RVIRSVAHLPAAVYRLYDDQGHLLYVGVTHDLEERYGAHRRNQLWWLDVVRSEHVWMPSRAEADAEEALAIEREKPLRDKS
ncbi:GIY-YIG nuclease family protein, partial [Streptomyces sp. GSL17-113]|uniref:GIY-YIG nuclease family protein n=1 Tax=Streptomyces sp. GSL17-113 TaxID=3115365 RepID=UPI002E76F332